MWQFTKARNIVCGKGIQEPALGERVTERVCVSVVFRQIARALIVAEIILRFCVGGIVVCLFAVFADALKPKSFAGLLGAAPSVALATLGLTVWKKGSAYAALEAQSMIFGAIAFFIYAVVVSRILRRGEWSALSVTAASLVLWLGCAFAFRYLALL
jgi:hypothetical protein